MPDSDPVPFFLSVPNSNPESTFSSFEIQTYWQYEDSRTEETVVAPVEAWDLDNPPAEHGPVFYALCGRFDPAKNPQHFSGVQIISQFPTLVKAKELLVALNGPIDEEEDN